MGCMSIWKIVLTTFCLAEEFRSGLGGRRTKEKWERILAYTSQNKTGTQSRAGSQTMNRQEELDEYTKADMITGNF